MDLSFLRLLHVFYFMCCLRLTFYVVCIEPVSYHRFCCNKGKHFLLPDGSHARVDRLHRRQIYF